MNEGTTLGRRVIGLLITLVAAGIIGMAIWLEPDASGLGTHTQFGLPRCNWIASFNLPCPTCGMTTAFSHAVRGQFTQAILAQPFGFLLSISTGAALLLGLYTVATGVPAWTRLKRWWGMRTVWLIVGLLVAAWVYKVLAWRGLL